MPATSKKQQKFMGIVHAIQKGEQPASKFSKVAQKAAKSMKKKSAEDYASTKHKGLPTKVKKEERDYKAEYKKFQSSTKAKKYRAELNQYNRKRGTYGNGDGKDASHKGGKIVGFEKESKNRGRAEKSRLKKEAIFEDLNDAQLSSRIKHWAGQHKGTGVGYGHVLGSLAIHLKEMGWDKSFKEIVKVAKELSKKKKVESVFAVKGKEGKDGYRIPENPDFKYDPEKKESVNEGKWSKIMTSVRKGSKAGPWSIVVYDKAKRKVIHNRIVKILQQIPAHYEDVKKKYPRASIGIEDKHGQRVYTESINEGTKAFLAYREMKEALNVAIYGIKKMRKFIDDAPYNPKFNMITKELYKWEIDLEKKWRRVVPQISKISKDKMLESVNEKMSPAQYHSYMQYVFDTQFKTPDEKKMKKSIIKKINVAQKKKGLPLYKESVNEKWSKGLERYKVTLENGKEIDVKVKEGVGLEGIGKLLEKEGLKFEKITKKASRPTLTPESVNEARETAIDIAKRVVKNKQHEKGLDLTTANFIVKIYDAYKEHPNLQRQMKKMPLPKMVKLAYKVMK